MPAVCIRARGALVHTNMLFLRFLCMPALVFELLVVYSTLVWPIFESITRDQITTRSLTRFFYLGKKTKPRSNEHKELLRFVGIAQHSILLNSYFERTHGKPHAWPGNKHDCACLLTWRFSIKLLAVIATSTQTFAIAEWRTSSDPNKCRANAAHGWIFLMCASVRTPVRTLTRVS